MAHHTLIDTCVWLDLAADPVADEIVSQIERLIEAKHFTLVVPQVVREEFDRHKPDYAEKLAKRLSGRVSETIKFVREYGDPASNAELIGGLEAFLKKVSDVSDVAARMVGRIDVILDHAENKRIQTATEFLERAASRGYKKQAPFIANKNSVADAVILEAFLEFIRKHGENHKCTFSFVTVNKSDFCDPGDHRKPHPELGEPFATGQVRFSINVAEEINRLINDLPAGTTHRIPDEIVQHVETWEGIGVPLATCPKCNERSMEFIGGHPSQYGGWTVWQMCKKCGYKWDTGDFID